MKGPDLDCLASTDGHLFWSVEWLVFEASAIYPGLSELGQT